MLGSVCLRYASKDERAEDARLARITRAEEEDGPGTAFPLRLPSASKMRRHTLWCRSEDGGEDREREEEEKDGQGEQEGCWECA